MAVGVDLFVHSSLEFYFPVGAFAVTDLEEFALREAKHAGDEVGREDHDFGVEVTDVAVVEAAGGLHLVFRVREFILEFQEPFVGLEVYDRLPRRRTRI